MLNLDTLDRLETIKADFADLNRRVVLAEADFEASQRIAADHRHRAEVAEAALAAIKAAIATVDGTISAPIEIKAEALAEVSEYPVEAPEAVAPIVAAPAPEFIPQSFAALCATWAGERASILWSLTHDWQTVLELHEESKAHGFKKGNQTVRNYMLAMMRDNWVRDHIEQRDKPSLAWRLKAKAPAPAPAPEALTPARTVYEAVYRSLDAIPKPAGVIWHEALAHIEGGDITERAARHALKNLTNDGKAIKIHMPHINGTHQWALAKVEAHSPPPPNDGLADLRAAIEKATGSKVGTDFKDSRRPD